MMYLALFFFFSSRRRHTRWPRDWSSDVCSSDLFTRPRSWSGMIRWRRDTVITFHSTIATPERTPASHTTTAEEVSPITDRKSTRLNSSHVAISYAVFCLKKKDERKEKHNTNRI